MQTLVVKLWLHRKLNKAANGVRYTDVPKSVTKRGYSQSNTSCISSAPVCSLGHFPKMWFISPNQKSKHMLLTCSSLKFLVHNLTHLALMGSVTRTGAKGTCHQYPKSMHGPATRAWRIERDYIRMGCTEEMSHAHVTPRVSSYPMAPWKAL